MQAETQENSSGGGSPERRAVSFLRSYCNHHARAAQADNDCRSWLLHLPFLVNAVFIFTLICTCQWVGTGVEPVAGGYVASSHFGPFLHYSVALSTA